MKIKRPIEYKDLEQRINENFANDTDYDIFHKRNGRIVIHFGMKIILKIFHIKMGEKMKIKDIEKKIGTLSNPSKMPSYAWGISAKHCNVGSKLAKIKGTICNKCYALKGHYAFKNVFDAHEIRRNAIEMPEWVDYMARLTYLKVQKPR